MLTNIRAVMADFISPELRAERRSLERAANYDSLTNVANRRAFDLALPAAEADPETAIVVFDLNNFGKINKAAGQRFGDIALKEIAAVIVRHAGIYHAAERVFRIGGDEFAVFIPAKLAASFRDQTERAYGVRYPAINVSIVGTFGPTFEAADSQLQDRKRTVKNGTTK